MVSIMKRLPSYAYSLFTYFTRNKRTVFISYRRSVSFHLAFLVFRDLRAHGYDVFLDVASIDNGTFDTVVMSQIPARAHFLIICTPGSFERCESTDDWLRREIESAIDCNRNIVPILASDFRFEDNMQYLTGKLTDLPRYNGLALPNEYFDEGMARLRNRYLRKPIDSTLISAPTVYKSAVDENMAHVVALPIPTKEVLESEEVFYKAYWRGSQGDLEGAIRDYKKAIALDPNNILARINLGETYFALRKYRLSRQEFNTILKHQPDNKVAQAGFAIALQALGLDDQALKCWRKLANVDIRYLDPDWVNKELHWRPEFVNTVARLMTSIGPSNT